MAHVECQNGMDQLGGSSWGVFRSQEEEDEDEEEEEPEWKGPISMMFLENTTN